MKTKKRSPRGSVDVLGTLPELGACRRGKDRVGIGEKGAGRAEATPSARPLCRASAPPGRHYQAAPILQELAPSPLPFCPPLPLPSLAHFSQLTHDVRRSPQFSPSPHTPDSGPLPASWRPPSFNPEVQERVRALGFRPGSSGGVGGSEPEGAVREDARFRPCCLAAGCCGCAEPKGPGAREHRVSRRRETWSAQCFWGLQICARLCFFKEPLFSKAFPVILF